MIKENISITLENIYINSIIPILDIYCIPVITGIIISYTNPKIDNFNDKNFINDCIKDGNYLYCTSEITLAHYLFSNNRLKDLQKLLKNASYLNVEWFQNKNFKQKTELWLFCFNNMSNIISRMNKLPMKYLTNLWKPNNEYHEYLTNLWKPNIEYNKYLAMQGDTMYWETTELYWIFKHKMHNVIYKINLIPEGVLNNITVPHRTTELHVMCQNKMHNFIINIKNIQPNHFLIADSSGYTCLSWLILRNMKDTILQLNDKFINNKWKVKHCSSNFEKTYMKKINIF